MCGIFGQVGVARGFKYRTLMSALTVLNQSRGQDSTGMATLSSNGQARPFKRVVKPSRFIGLKKYKNLVRRQSDVTIGHTRAASVGGVTKGNAHPFTFDGVTGVHNGTVSNLQELTTHTGQEFTSDSQHLLYSVANTGGVGPAAGGLNLAYWDTNWDNGLSLRLHRYNRPLAMAYVDMEDDREAVVFSSELRHLRAACAIAELDIMSAWGIENFTQVDLFYDAKRGTVEIDEVELALPEPKWPDYMMLDEDEDPEISGGPSDIEVAWGV